MPPERKDGKPTPEEVATLHDRLDREAKAGGYILNPDRPFTARLVEGLIVNERRYGYRQCPCRRAHGERSKDLDVICPCDYRDADVEEHGACYCALYVSRDWADGKVPPTSVPERRPPEYAFDGYAGPAPAAGAAARGAGSGPTTLPYPVWRCKVCGYLAARDGPPGTCPVCKATKDRFERFM